jgi:hypothetical protein
MTVCMKVIAESHEVPAVSLDREGDVGSVL